MNRKDLDGKAMCERILALLGSRRKLDAANTLDVSGTRISEWLHGKGSPPFDILLAVQHLTGCTLDYLVHGVQSGRPPNIISVAGRVAAADAEHGCSPLPLDDTGERAVVELPDGLLAWKVIGDSMEPIVLDGQYVLTKQEVIEPIRRDGGIWVVNVQQSERVPEPFPGWYCKRVKRMGDALVLMSHNPSAATPFTAWRSNCRLWPVVGVYFAGAGVSPDV